MADEKKFKERSDTSLKSASLANFEERDVASGKECKSSDLASISLMGDANSVMKGESDQEPDAEKGHAEAYPERNEHGYFLEGDGSEIPYSGPKPNASAAAPLKSKGLNSVKKSGPVVTKVSALLLDSKSCLSAVSSMLYKSPPHSPHLKSLKEVPQMGLDLRSAGLVKGRYPVRKFSSLTNQVQGPLPHNVPVSYTPNGRTLAGYDRFELGENPVRKFSSSTNQVQGPLPHNSPVSYTPSGQPLAGYGRFELGEKFNRSGNFETSREPNHGPRARGVHTPWSSSAENNQFEFREKFNRDGNFEASRESNRGPRARGVHTPLSSSAENNQLGVKVRRDKYNLQDFQTVYENAKFFVIKSYSEDDIHKSIKYDVWASTPNGNKKLDAVFHDAETRSNESGTSCPIFLFFSVNGSGQFVGLAQMIGQVDFKKDMDFWQLDKWNGFFPVKWHIIKDIPNGKLRHIILENNDNKPVTYTRDTQEIGFKQGSEMLTIFKSYATITSMLDDYKFYEDQEKSLRARGSKAVSPQIEIYGNNFPQKQYEGVRKTEQASMRAKRSDSKTSMVVNLTKNLSLNSHRPKAIAGKDTRKEW